QASGADEGTVWLADAGGEFLMPVWNNGPDAERFVGRFQLPAAEGITGWVFTGGMATCETEVCFHQKQHRELDRRLGVLTWAMLAVPLRAAGETRGVITAVRLIRLADLPGLSIVPRSSADFPEGFKPPPSFSVSDLAAMESTAQVLGRLLDHRVHCWTLGIEE
ncbi:MAG: GAF domain-containing protein, partial [Prosthecobacter sp.]|nr:GAF domain-containing protein [Prosthecobacter sp.]